MSYLKRCTHFFTPNRLGCFAELPAEDLPRGLERHPPDPAGRQPGQALQPGAPHGSRYTHR